MIKHVASLSLDISKNVNIWSLHTVFQGVTKRCRLSWLTNSALVYEPNAGGGGVAGSQTMSTDVQERKINFGDLTPYLTCAVYRQILFWRARVCWPFRCNVGHLVMSGFEPRGRLLLNTAIDMSLHYNRLKGQL